MISISQVTEHIDEQKIELVERKGIGHPDSICDGIAEEISRVLCKKYLEEFGVILHHNVDKILLSAGETIPKFGGGEIIEPIYIVLAGRATKELENIKIPVDEFALQAAKNYLKKILPNLDIDCGVVIDSKIRQGSIDLRNLFKKEILANDTSFGVGYAPLSELESIVLDLERFLNSPRFKEIHPELGSDIKVMGLRDGNKLKITVAGAFVSKHVANLEDYLSKKQEIYGKMKKFIEEKTEKEFELFFNLADNPNEGSVYLTICGSSCECGDDGEVGRGNRVNGLITPNRYMSLEAAAGKNPKTHTGKIYNVLAEEIAREVYNSGAKEVYVKILSQIGKPIKEPLILSVKISPFEQELISKAREIAKDKLNSIDEITKKIIEGKISVF